MKDAYGIFTTDGETVAGTLHDESAVRLAERLDESTASLYISTRNGVLLLGTAVNVQKTGRRPDTVIYLEKTGWDRGHTPEIDLAYIHAFYVRVVQRLGQIDYTVRDPAMGEDFFDERHSRFITALTRSDMVDYSVGRLLLGKEVVCLSGDLSKSVDFAVAVTERLHSLLYPGFTLVVARRAFRDADLLVTEKFTGTVHIDLATERADGARWVSLYRRMGIFARTPHIRQQLSRERTRQGLAEALIAGYTNSISPDSGKSGDIEAFLADEMTDVFKKSPEAFTPAAYEPPVKEEVTRPDESDYGKWRIEAADRREAERTIEAMMQKKRKARVRLIVVTGIFAILLAVILFIVVAYPELLPPGPPENTTEVPRITPSATIVPDTGTGLVIRLNTTPGNIPAGRSGIGSAYEVTVSAPRNMTIGLTTEIRPDVPYYLMLYNQSGRVWEEVNTTVFVSNESATAYISESGIYRLFTDRDTGLNTSAGNVSLV